MRTRTLGISGCELSVVGFGAAAVGAGRAYGNVRRETSESLSTIRRALDCGISWIDTAALYGAGEAERLVGTVVAGRPQGSVFVATKGGYYIDDDGQSIRALRRHEIRDQLSRSLRRLGREYVDLYQIHWPRPEEDIEDGWTGVAEAVEKGLVLHGGVSNFSVPQMERLQSIHPIASLQPRYSMFRREIESEIVPYCRENGVGIVVYSPMESGILTGRFTGEYVAGLPDGDWRRNNVEFNEPRLSLNLGFVESLRVIADERDITVGQLAVAWTLRLPEITSAIVGARRPEQIEETAPAGDIELSAAEIDQIEGLLADREEQIGRL